MSKARDIADLGSNDVLETSSTGLDVTGTLSADGLTVDVGTDKNILIGDSGGEATIYTLNDAQNDNIDLRINAENLNVYTDGTKGLTVADNGDFHLYEDTGTTAKFVWDSSAEELEIGSSTDKLELGASFQRFRKGNENKILIGNTSSALGSGTGLINYLYDPEPFIWYQGAERMRIDSSGNVGIGTDSPSEKLHVRALTSPEVLVQAITANSANSGRFVVKEADAAGYGAGFRYDGDVNTASIFGIATNVETDVMTWSRTGATIQFKTVGSERARIDSSGNLLVGQTSSTARTNGVSIQKGSTGFTYQSSWNDTGAKPHVAFYNPNGKVGSIETSGSSTNYITSSDHRLKENVVSMDNASDRVLALKPCRFNFIADPDKTVDGFLAHEAQEVVPEAVHGTKDAMKTEEYEVTPAVEAAYDEDGNEITPAVEAVMGTREVPDYQGIDQSKLVPLLTKALQEALTRIEALENANGNS